MNYAESRLLYATDYRPDPDKMLFIDDGIQYTADRPFLQPLAQAWQNELRAALLDNNPAVDYRTLETMAVGVRHLTVEVLQSGDPNRGLIIYPGTGGIIMKQILGDVLAGHGLELCCSLKRIRDESHPDRPVVGYDTSDLQQQLKLYADILPQIQEVYVVDDTVSTGGTLRCIADTVASIRSQQPIQEQEGQLRTTAIAAIVTQQAYSEDSLIPDISLIAGMRIDQPGYPAFKYLSSELKKQERYYRP